MITKLTTGLFLKGLSLLIIFFVSVLFVIIEILKYDGFIKKHLVISLDHIFLFTIILIIFLTFNQSLKKIFPQYLFSINKFLNLPILLVYLVFTTLETINYPNYVYSRFNINHTRIDELFVISTVLLISNYYKTDHTIKINKSFISKYLPIIFFSTITTFALLQLQVLIKDISTDLAKNVQSVISSEKNRFEIKAGPGVISEGYRYTNFVIDNTETDSVIQLPPKTGAWKSTGNIVYMRGFLYPRVLIQDEKLLLLNEADYILISKGLWSDENNGWPKETISKELIDYILYFDINSQEVTRTESDYQPNNNKWGIIKLK